MNDIFGKSKLQKFIEFIFIFCTILECYSIYTIISNKYDLIIQLIWTTSLIILFIYACLKLKYKDTIDLMSFLFIFGSIMLLFFLFEFFYYPMFPKNLILKLCIYPIMIIVYFYAFQYNHKECNTLFYYFEDIMVILALLSIIFWILALLKITPKSTVNASNWYGNGMVAVIPTYFHIGFIVGNGATWFGTQFIRNSGIFTEPSMFSYPLTVALLIELFIRKHENILNKKTIILLMVIISTASTTGIVFSFLALFLAVFLNYKNYIKYFGILLIPILYILLKTVILNKINASQNDSYAVRSEDIKSGLKAWKNHIFFGNGIGNVDSIKRYFNEERFITHHAGISAGFTTVLAFGGIMLGLFYLLPLICSFYISSSLALFTTFTLLPLIYVAVQDRFICIIIISYVWSKFIFRCNHENIHIHV